MRRFALSLFMAVGLSSLQACGAGLVGAFIASNDDPPPTSPPGLSLPESRFPLVPAATASTSFRTVVVSNVQLQGTAGLQIEIRALGVRAVQGSPVIVSGQGGSTVVGFLLRTEEILAVAGDPTAQDLPGQLAVVSSGKEVAEPVPVQLLKQARATLVLPPPQTALFLSPLGGSRIRLALSGLRAVQPGDLQVLVTTSDPSGNSPSITRQCTGIGLAPGPGADSTVSADVPGNTFSGRATFVVVDSVAGRSTEVIDAYYRPEVTVALPAQGPTTGGSLVTLIGRALAPLDKSTLPPAPAFDQVEILFQKGDRDLKLLQQDLRPQESDLDRLVFTMPVSPDGRPGSVDIVLRVHIGAVTAEVKTLGRFTFANPQPVFGPRGAVLDRPPVASAPIRLESAPGGTDAPDFGLLYSEAGVGFLQLLTAEENGMFIRFGGSRQLGNPANANERDPQDLCVGDFDGDSVPDLLAINKGSASGTHHLTLGQPLPKPPLGPIKEIPADGAAQRCVAADLDGDGKQDFVLLPGQHALPGALPSVWLARPRAQGDPEFFWVGNVPVRPGLREQILVQDLDGDGFLDVAVARGGLPVPVCDIAYGNGSGGFVAGPRLDVVINDYGTDVASPLVGLHACGNVSPRPVVLVFATPLPPPTPPPLPPPDALALAVLLPLSSRTYDPVVAGDVQPLPAPLVASLSADLDRDGVPELVLAFRNTPEDPLAFSPLVIARWNGSSYQPLAGAVERGAEELFNLTALHFGTVFPPDTATGRAEVNGVFVLHDSKVDGVIERRLSTLLVSGPPVLLLAPDAGGQIQLEVKSVVGGSFAEVSRRTNGSTRDMVLGGDDQVRILRNDGAGGFFSQVSPQAALRIVPSTLTRMQAPVGSTGVDSLAWLDRDSRLSVWLPYVPPPPPPEPPPPQPVPQTSVELRLQSPTPRLRTADVADSSRMVSTDVDGDGVLDLVVMLTFQVGQPGEGDALLFLLRGKATVQSGEFPFHLPTSPQAVTPLHGRSTSVALADFVRFATGPVQLEAAVAIPTNSSQGNDGDQVRFYRYVAGAVPGEDRLVRSSAAGPTALLAGDRPIHLAAADFDNNGTDDLLVAGDSTMNIDGTLRLFLNSGDPGSNPVEVNVGAFRESLTSPLPVSPGAITSLRLGDINGDGNVDALLSTQSVTATQLSSAVAFYLSDGTGSFANPVFVSPTRIGNRNAVLSIDLSDFNGDAQLDIAVAWNTAGGGDRNVRVLFGGSR